MVIHQGDVLWADLGPIRDSSPAGRRPVVVLQSDRFNRSDIQTTIVAVLTTNLGRGEAPGNVRLSKGEAGLPRASVVNVSQLRTLDKSVLRDRLGRLAATRLREVLAGVGLVFDLVS